MTAPRVMDIPRPRPTRTWVSPRRLLVGSGVALLALFWWWSRQNTVPVVPRTSVTVATVERGSFVLDVQANGRLVPARTHFLTALTSARVERVLVRSGQLVKAGEPVLQMANPDVAIRALEAEHALGQATRELQLGSAQDAEAQLTQRGVLASLAVAVANAERELTVAESLAANHLVAPADLAQRRAVAREQQERLALEQSRLTLMARRERVDGDARAANVTRLTAIAQFQRAREGGLALRAPESGVLQDLLVEPGQWITEGTTVARIFDPRALVAVVRVGETEARDVAVGAAATIDTRRGVIRAHVLRRDAAAQGGTVAVTLALDEAPPTAVVADQSIDARIEIAREADVLHVVRPALVTGGSGSRLSVYRLSRDGTTATRLSVSLGRLSSQRAEIRGGLTAGDRIIVSDMSAWGDAPVLHVR